MTARISAASRQRMRPSLSVVQTVPSKRRKEAPPELFATETDRAVQEAWNKVLEADRDLEGGSVPVRLQHGGMPSFRTRGFHRSRRPHSIPSSSRTGRRSRPQGNRSGFIEPTILRHDSVAVSIRVVTGSNVVRRILAHDLEEGSHGVRGGAVHVGSCRPSRVS